MNITKRDYKSDIYEGIIKNARNQVPIIHCITNNVTINDVANIILAAGGSPIMADEKDEMKDITKVGKALVINMGVVKSEIIESMIVAGKEANKIGNPVILDPVGVGASKLRTEIANKIIQEVKIDIIRGNVSEIKSLAVGGNTTKGVDASEEDKITVDNLEFNIKIARELSIKTGAIIGITGEIDIVVDQNNACIIKNGHEMMTKVTGTGCMLSGVIGTFVAANRHKKFESTVIAISAMGYCGEIAYSRLVKQEGVGTSTYRTFIIDAMSMMSDEMMKRGKKIEIR